MWIMNKPLWGKGKTVIMYSGLFLLKGFIGLFDRDVYGIELVKKCICWSTGIYVD